MILGMTALGEGRMPALTRLEMSVAHALGGALGGALMAALVWLAATPVRTILSSPVPEFVVAGAAVVAVGIDTHLLHVHNRTGQVPAVWFARYGPQRSYAIYGFLFGAAFATLRPFAVIYAIFLALGMLVGFPAAVFGGALFGLGRTVLIGPASLRATGAALVLYRAPGVHRYWAGGSVVLSLTLVWTAIGHGAGVL
jgi:hypothetical protein